MAKLRRLSMLREQLEFAQQQRGALQRNRQNRAANVAVVTIDGPVNLRGSEYACAVPGCLQLADTQCDHCAVWICGDHGPNHDRHSDEVDEAVVNAYLDHIASAAAPAATSVSPRQAPAATPAAAPTGPTAHSVAGCKRLLRQLGVSERDIDACKDKLRVLQALIRAKRGNAGTLAVAQRRIATAATTMSAAMTDDPPRPRTMTTAATTDQVPVARQSQALATTVATSSAGITMDTANLMGLFFGAFSQFVSQQQQNQRPQQEPIGDNPSAVIDDQEGDDNPF